MNLIPYFFTLTEEERLNTIEAIIFSTEEHLTSEKLLNLLNTTYENDNKLNSGVLNENFCITISDLELYIEKINLSLAESNRPFFITQFADGYQFTTVKSYGKIVSFFIKSKFKKKLTNSMLETLSIIAYKQPISKPEIEQIRGVNSKEVINNLIDRNLVKIIGRSDNLGKALLYGTSNDFLQTFGIRSIEDLPKLRDLEEVASSIDTLDSEESVITLKVTQEEVENLKRMNLGVDMLEDDSRN